ncbi:hypothetical protein BDN72DRAFT_382746 [Pluteus cervinus]|uniref:Uncharacterized protein n=1 Tax=Pluteus cervinus TaxID=181527 RepID=A0ACD3AAH1_9AGAR|nr:hypothetical protein BDN72DRAFT_382746 [Pluteus cervinus]
MMESYIFDSMIVEYGNLDPTYNVDIYGIDYLSYLDPLLLDSLPSQMTVMEPSTVIQDPEPQTISLSTAFNPDNVAKPDLIFCSSDSVLFYVNTHTISRASPDAFRTIINSQLDTPHATDPAAQLRVVPIPETSNVLNVMLHTLYGTPCAQHSPTFDTLVNAVGNMPRYGISPATHIVRSSHTYSALVSYAPLCALDLYALAAYHRLEDLAVATSSHLLACSLSVITDDVAQKIGSIYLKRLFDLHLGRFNALKRVLLTPPHPHPPSKECTFVDQRNLTRSWALVSAYLAWDARADLSTHSMKLAFKPLIENLACELCQESLDHKLRDAVVQWASVKRTI